MTTEITTPSAAEQIAQMLGSAEPDAQLKQLQDLLVRVQMPPITLMIEYDPVTSEARIFEPAGRLSADGVQLALAAAGKTLAQYRIEEQRQQQQQQAELLAKATPRGRKKG